MKTVCITLSQEHSSHSGGERDPNSCRTYYKSLGLEVDYFIGVHAPNLGLKTIHPYELDAPGSGYNMGPRCVGCWLSHRTLWASLQLLPDEEFLILEDDARFCDNWKARLDGALRDVPQDWDMLYIGSCCTQGKSPRHVAGEVFEVHPMCTHAYCVKKKALGALIQTQDEARCYAPIDISLVLHSHPKMRVYTVLPRICDQWNMDLVP